MSILFTGKTIAKLAIANSLLVNIYYYKVKIALKLD